MNQLTSKALSFAFYIIIISKNWPLYYDRPHATHQKIGHEVKQSDPFKRWPNKINRKEIIEKEKFFDPKNKNKKIERKKEKLFLLW